MAILVVASDYAQNKMLSSLRGIVCVLIIHLEETKKIDYNIAWFIFAKTSSLNAIWRFQL